MRRPYFGLLCFLMLGDTKAAEPSKAAIYSCLSAQSVQPSVKWRTFRTTEINSEDDYKDGFDAAYYIVVNGKEIGYAEKGESKALLYDRKIFPLELAQALTGFEERPTELDPFTAEWGSVTDGSGRFLCVSFPYGVLGQSGSFQTNRSAYLMPLTGAGARQVLFAATGNIASFTSLTSPLPTDVRAFIKHREQCDHFRGAISDSSETQRMKEVNRKLHMFCKQTDRTLAELRKKYAGNSAVMAILGNSEDRIEPHQHDGGTGAKH